jgi:hypothetical protein
MLIKTPWRNGSVLTSDQEAACSNHGRVRKWIILCFRSTYNLRQPSGNLSSRFHSAFGASFDFSDVDFTS